MSNMLQKPNDQPIHESIGRFDVVLETLRSGLSKGVQRLTVKWDECEASILPTRGMSIEHVIVERFRFGWESPILQPVHPMFVPISEPSGFGFLDGFNELLVRCGLTSNGAPEHDAQGQLVYPLHGRIGNLPASHLEIRQSSEGVLEVEAWIDEVRFHFDKWRLKTIYRFRIGESSIEIVDRVENLAGTTRDFQMLYHYNLGKPLLGKGAKIHAPLDRIVPRNNHSAAHIDRWDEIEAPQAGSTEQVFFCRPRADKSNRSLAMLRNADSTAATAIEFSLDELTCFSLWKNTVAEADGYVIGLEPATNFPNPRSFEQQQGRTVALEPGDSADFHVKLYFAVNAFKTEQLIARCSELQRPTPVELNTQPDPSWCKIVD